MGGEILSRELLIAACEEIPKDMNINSRQWKYPSGRQSVLAGFFSPADRPSDIHMPVNVNTAYH